MIKYFNPHNHTMYSNIKVLDSNIRPDELIDKAIDLGLSGLAITEHECLSSHVFALKYMEKIQADNPEFKLALGDEIYLTDTRDKGQKYYHFILIAKDAIGHRALREISSTAWFYSFKDRGQERTPILKDELANIVRKYKGHLIATSACIGGELSKNALAYSLTKEANDVNSARVYYDNIINFIEYCLDIFGSDFYIECAPSDENDQVRVNKMLKNIADNYNIKMVVGTDSHYLRPEDRPVHKAYLTSDDSEREVDAFYKFTYLMSGEEVKNLMSYSFDEEHIDNMLANSLEIYDKIERYSLFHKQNIPPVKVKDYPKKNFWGVNNSYADDMESYPQLKKMFTSDNIQNRYWINQCWDKLKEQFNCETDIDLLDAAPDYLEELEEEARVKDIISEKLETNMFQYPNTIQHYIDLIWDCGSMVGAGRGSSCAALNHYLMGITQLDPIEWDLPFFRYLNEERVELGDIDIDICPSKRPLIIEKIKEERSTMFNEDIPDWAKNNLGCTLVATFGTEKPKSAVQTACRGYRSDDYPEGIDVDEALYLSSLIPEERGFLWPIHDVIFGNEETNRKPVTTFIKEVNKYPGLLDIIINIEGIINHRGSHASGLILFDDDPFKLTAFMKTPSGDITTQFDLHDAEYMGLTKYDFLVTDVQDKLVEAIKLMQEDEVLEKDLSLREIYDKYFHPNVLPLKDNKKLWDALRDGSVINIFQFDSLEGAKAAKQIKPTNILEMADANGLMRLMGEEGQVRPIERYCKYKDNLDLWYREMDEWGLTPEEQQSLEPYFKPSFGTPPSQEQLMRMLMDKDICGFTLGEANAARKIVGKKQMEKIPALKNKVLTQAHSPQLGAYVWKYGAGPQMGYSFSVIHALAYSFIGAQTLHIATNWNPIYWNTACLIVNSGSLEDNSEEELVDIYAPESDDFANGITFQDLPDRSGKIRKTASTDYGKMAKALGDIINAGIKVSLVDINKSDFGFKPDTKNNQILFGMKALLNVSDETVREIINNRPYISPKDFLLKVKPKKQAMISLIKSGAFDLMMNRKECMAWYIWETCDKKKRLTLQNLPGLIKYGLLPETNEQEVLARRVYEFNRYLKAVCKQGDVYALDERAISFLQEMGYDELISDELTVNPKAWDKKYQNWMNVFRDWIAKDKEGILDNLNTLIFKEDWDKYASGTISSWEMETMCFYYHKHELEDINKARYGFEDFFKLPEEPEVESYFSRKKIPIYKLHTIAGTCIAKNKTKSIVTILTTTGVVNVKFRKEYFSLFDKQISEKQADGKKKVMERSWFNRGNMIVVMGIRQGDNFIAKKYASSAGHQLYKINQILKDGSLVLQTERYQIEGE